MNKVKYEALLTQKQNESKSLHEKRRINVLDSFGLFEKVTSATKTDEYPFADYEGEQVTYYKKVYEDITDEELDKLIELDNQLKGITFDQQNLKLKSNNIKLSFILGFIMVITGIILAMFFLDDGLVGFALISLVSSLTMASILFSLSQVATQLNWIIKILISNDKNKQT